MDNILDRVKYLAGLVVIGLALLFAFWPFVSVAPYERGVITRFGKIVRTSEPGLNFKLPFVERYHDFRIDIQSLAVEGVDTYTIDNQKLVAKLNVNFRIPADGVGNIYTNVPDYEARLKTMVIDRFKNALGKLNVVQVTQKRSDITADINNTIKADAERLYGLEIVDFQITNIDYTFEFEKATEQAMTAKARVEQNEQEKRQAEVVAEKVKIEAAGQANAKIEQARGEAESKLTIAKAEAEAIRLQGLAKAEALNAQAKAIEAAPQLVEMKKAEQWNGQLPQQMLGGTIPLMNIGQSK